MQRNEVHWAQEMLNYSDTWLELGVLTNEIALNQMHLWMRDDADKNTEHYRYGAWRHYWNVKKSITSSELEKCIILAISDPDVGMGGAILHDILNAYWLSEKQFELVSEQFRTFRDKWSLPNSERIIDRQLLYRSLTENNSPKDLDRVVRIGDSQIQRHVVDRYRLHQETLEYLEKKGLVRAVRNIARVKLRRREHF
ncbi:MAG: hypothetical protein ABJQ34_04300 [Paracoccaceae bacterium]